VQYLVGVFDQFWQYAVPWDDEVPVPGAA